MADGGTEEVVMTPTKKGKATLIKIERKHRAPQEEGNAALVAGGKHRGLVINKQTADDVEDDQRPTLQLGFMCFLVDQKTGQHYVESRKLKFWFREGTEYFEQVTTAYEFFKELVRPENFPRDYVGFIKKCMKQMQGAKYQLARKVDLEIRTLEEAEAPLSPGLNKVDMRSKEEIAREKLLTVLESAYPNVLSVEDLVRITTAEEGLVLQILDEMRGKELVREMENGGFVRHVLDEKTEVQMVKQMPTIAVNQQPTIAIITALYSEKLAVDAMMENKTTYMKFKTEGESNVYTIGYIGEHKVVSTKLPAIGHFRAAQISSGNTTTRLLGSFQNIEHVFVVGVAGGVPHYTDFYKHVRLGDVIISRNNQDGHMYYYCDKILQDKQRNIIYNLKTFAPRELELQQIAEKLQDTVAANPDFAPWEKYIDEGQEMLQAQESSFARPEASTDHLYMSIGDNQVIEVHHPEPPPGAVLRVNTPRMHLGVFGAGRPVMRNDTARLDFASRYNIIGFDSEFDQVLESIVGNRKDSFLFVRGVADYMDGSKGKDWQPYAALVAASVTKTIIRSLANPNLDNYD